MPLSPARKAAFKILTRIESASTPVSEYLFSKSVNKLKVLDRGLTTELIYGVLRQRKLLDWYLSSLIIRPLNKVDNEVMTALRLGAYQILFLSRIPDRAAVHQSVELLRKVGQHIAAGGMVNAVLRKVNKVNFDRACKKLSQHLSNSLSILYSHPEWLVNRWINRWGLLPTRDLLKHNNLVPPVHFRSNSPELASIRIGQLLEREGINVGLHGLGKGVWQVISGNLTESELFKSGKVVIQDAGSQVIPSLLDLHANDCCLDFCGGIGGKASRIAQLGRNNVKIISLDSNLSKLQLSKCRNENQWRNIHWIVADGTYSLPISRQFNKILVDVVCSGSGTLRRHPEIRWRLKPSDLDRLSVLQSKLLANASSVLKRGGLLVYATCSLEPEENEQVVHRFLSENPHFYLERLFNSEINSYCDQDGFIRLLPNKSSPDGFFGAVLRKV
ncbi:MAG: 16S rRNA (cytosine(967)-C(5))-methyltransferase RsmB [Acidobacteriia bacterium]|nr:16S rRNA (cytosine(967)-C(5))-methyltransferase RsmB [Terriglobia bacterium]